MGNGGKIIAGIVTVGVVVLAVTHVHAASPAATFNVNVTIYDQDGKLVLPV